MAEHPVPIPVRLADGAESGLARIVQQFLEQDQAEFEHKRRRAARLRGRVAMTASDHGATVTLEFRGGEILVHDGEQGPVDASIEGPHKALVRLLQGESIDPTRLTAVSFGEYAPVADNDTPEGRAYNRRIEIRLKPVKQPAQARAESTPGS